MSIISRDVRESGPPAERIAAGLMAAMKDHDPVEAVCALAMVASHYIVTVGTEGCSPTGERDRLQHGVHRELLERVVELCHNVRRSGAN